MIKASINLSKIDKSRIREDDKGQKWIDIMIIPTPSAKYGDHMISESVSKAERDNGVRGNILGNGKNVGR